MRDQQLSITEHLLELRRRLTWAAVAVVICTGAAFAFHQQILTLLMAPAAGFTDIPNEKPIYTDITEFLGIAAKVSLVVGLFASMPFVLYQLVMFAAPGLRPRERRYLYFLLPASLIAFVAGAAFGYRILFPPAVNFLLSFGSDIATPFIRIGTYINLMVSLLFWMGIVFETPVVLFFLSKIGVVTPEFLSRKPAVRHRHRVHPGGHHHSHFRSHQPVDGRRAHHRAVRAEHLAGQARPRAPQARA